MSNTDMFRDIHALCGEYQKLSADGKKRFTQAAKEMMSDEEFKAFIVLFTIADWDYNPDKMRAIRQELGNAMYNDIMKNNSK